jgi:two-component system, cell cycle response regulator
VSRSLITIRRAWNERQAKTLAVTSRKGSVEVASIAERMVYMQALRVVFAFVVLASGIFTESLIGAPLESLTVPTVAYLLCSAGVEVLRRLEERRGMATVMMMLLVDGIFLAWILYATGGSQSPLRFLTFLHLIVVTLIVSYRTGLKIALLHSSLFVAVFYAEKIELLVPNRSPIEPPADLAKEYLVFNVLAVWLVALATAIFSRLNERELRRSRFDFERLAVMGAELEHLEGPQDISMVLLRNLKEAYGFRRGVVLAAQKGDPWLLASIGVDEIAPQPNGRDAVIDRAWKRREILLIKKLDLEVNAGLARLLPFARNLVIVPLFAESHPFGVVALEQPSRLPRIERRAVSMISEFASHVALALRNAWLLEQLRQAAESDGLTGIANRPFFDASLEEEITRAVKNESQFTLVLLDLDHFKDVNDRYGHLGGDKILREVARILSEVTGPLDIVSRFGGEEFAVLLPGCMVQQSFAAADRLRKAISQVKDPGPVTASAGVATFPFHATDAISLIRVADEALYRSKELGRNRVTVSWTKASPL